MDLMGRDNSDLSKPVKREKKFKRIKQVGKQGLNWRRTRAKWIADNPPDHRGNYYCYLCGAAISKGKPSRPNGRMTLDHIIPRSRAPHLRYVSSNLASCCWDCNIKKGSRVYT